MLLLARYARSAAIKRNGSSRVFACRGGRRGLLETEKLRKKSPKSAKPQNHKTESLFQLFKFLAKLKETEIKALTDKALVGFRLSLSVV